VSSKEYFKKEGGAKIRQEELASKGIKSHMLVDPMDSIHPSLGEFQGIELLIDDTIKEPVKVSRVS